MNTNWRSFEHVSVHGICRMQQHTENGNEIETWYSTYTQQGLTRIQILRDVVAINCVSDMH
jgi:hypothetical protein